jgi:sugar lactone lactonase YvrE
VARHARQGARALLVAALVMVDFLAMVLDRLVPEPEGEKRQGIPTNVAIGLAVAIPVVIVLAAVGMALLGAEKSEFQTYVERARSAHAEAMRLSDGKCDNQALRPLWAEVLRLTELADDLRPNDPNVLVMRADAQNYLDCFDDVVRRDLRLLHTYPRDADMAALVVHGGVDLYALDRQNGVVYHGTLNERGDSLSDSGDKAVIWTGQTISGATGNFTVGRIVDIEWLADGGTRPKNVLVALDTNGLLVAYSPTYFTSAQQLVTEGRWQEPVALAVYRSNLYVLDRAANQIWRYVPPAGAESYPNAPEEYFNGEQLPDLTGAVDFGISDDGAVYILFSDGTVRRYRRNVQGIVEEQPFEFRQRPPGAIVSGSALFVDNDPASRNLYVVDPQGETIYETSWAGTFNQGYRPRNLLDAFKDARAFYADAVVRNNMYVLSGNRLYHFYRFQ